MIIFAIDPGISGALVAYIPDTNEMEYYLTPTMEVGKSNRVNGAAVACWVKGILHTYKHAGSIVHCFIEKVGAMPGQGVTGMFSFGHSTGLVEGVVTALEIPITLVTPQAWKKHAGLLGQDKDAARTRCIQLYPTIADLSKKGKGQAISDAILIAKYGFDTL